MIIFTCVNVYLIVCICKCILFRLQAKENEFASLSLSQDQVIDEEFELLVLASDGLWDVVPNEVNLT